MQTTEYSGTLNPASALKLLPASARSLVGSALKQVSGSIHFTVWIDGSDQVKRLAESETIAGQSVHEVITILAYNQPVHVAIPSASQIYSGPAGAGSFS